MQEKVPKYTLSGGTKIQTDRLLPNLECLPTYNLGHVHLKYFTSTATSRYFFRQPLDGIS